MRPKKLQLQFSLKSSAAIILFLFVLLAGSQLQAANKVVIIPLLGNSSKLISNVVTVAQKNGDFTDPVTAIASITDASPENRYLVYIAPGIYKIFSQLRMKPYVNVTGSGKDVTILTGSRSSSELNSSAALITLASSSTLSNVITTNLQPHLFGG